LLPATFFTLFIAVSVVKFLKNSVYTFNCRKKGEKTEKKKKYGSLNHFELLVIGREL